jgi:hypothetical protein
MTPDTQARAGYRRPPVHQLHQPASGTAARAEGLAGAVAHPGQRSAPAHPSPASPVSRGPAAGEGQPRPSRTSARAARRAREEASIAKVIPLLAVVVVTAAGIYIAWLKGSAGGGEGGVVSGTGLLVAALARLLLPTQVVGLLATRSRTLDVVTLAAFGVCLLVAGLVLPR